MATLDAFSKYLTSGVPRLHKAKGIVAILIGVLKLSASSGKSVCGVRESDLQIGGPPRDAKASTAVAREADDMPMPGQRATRSQKFGRPFPRSGSQHDIFGDR